MFHNHFTTNSCEDMDYIHLDLTNAPKENVMNPVIMDGISNNPNTHWMDQVLSDEDAPVRASIVGKEVTIRDALEYLDYENLRENRVLNFPFSNSLRMAVRDYEIKNILRDRGESSNPCLLPIADVKIIATKREYPDGNVYYAYADFDDHVGYTIGCTPFQYRYGSPYTPICMAERLATHIATSHNVQCRYAIQCDTGIERALKEAGYKNFSSGIARPINKQ